MRPAGRFEIKRSFSESVRKQHRISRGVEPLYIRVGGCLENRVHYRSRAKYRRIRRSCQVITLHDLATPIDKDDDSFQAAPNAARDGFVLGVRPRRGGGGNESVHE